MKEVIFSAVGRQQRAFVDFKYERPDIEGLSNHFYNALDRFRAAPSYAVAEEAMQELYRQRAHFMTMYNICLIRHTGDTRDAFYEAENDFFDQTLPRFEELKTDFYRALLATPYRNQLADRWGAQLFRIAELSLKSFRPEILADLQEENRLASEYDKLKAKAQITLNGDVFNLSTIEVRELDPDRNVRRQAATARWDWFAERSGEFDRIFNELVRVRTKVARQLGFPNFTPLGYVRMLRTDYDAAKVARFRNEIARHVVPLARRQYERQRERVGLDHLYFYDENYRFAEGAPRPLGDPHWIIEQAGRMYGELSAETDTFFRFMREGQLMDLVARDGKATGGYCTFIDDEGAPFIFSNFNGTNGDIDVLTHEAGHAFQVYSSRHHGVSEYFWPTYDACEIHSMSMEFFTWPWMQLFFGDQTARYQYGHLNGAITFLPYGVAVDEFQHFAYDNPDAGPQQRNQAWSALEKRYLPHRDYAGNAYLEGGGYWQKQSHIYGSPFYYIDYTLAQICAFQFWQRDRKDHAAAWADYVRLCQAGGGKSFLELVALAGLRSPFDPGCVADTASAVGQWLQQQDM